MNTRLGGMFLLAVLIAGGAWYVSQRNDPATEVVNAPLLPGFLDRINDTARMRIESPDGTLTIQKEGDRWVVEEFGGYPAKVEKVRELLVQLGNLRILERKTSKPENYALLKVEDRAAQNSESRAITATDKEGSPVVDLLVGKERPTRAMAPPGHYVRRSGEANAWLVEGDLVLGTKATDWVDTAVVDLPVDRVRQVSITPAGGETIVVSKPGPEVQLYSLAEVPAGQEVKARATVSSMGGLLLDARLEKVVKADRLSGQEPTAVAVVETFDGLTATLRRYEHEGKGMVTLEFAHTPDKMVAPAAAPSDAPKPEEMNQGPPPTPLKSPAEVAAEVKTLNTRVHGWAYLLPDYKTRLLEKKLEDLLKKKP